MPSTISASALEKFTTFGDLLRFLRRHAGITQMELAVAVGYSDAQISRLEQNLRLPDPHIVKEQFIPALYLNDEPRAAARLLDLAANVRREDAPDPGLCPYKGLSYFDEIDADLFMGREALTATVMERALALAASPQPERQRFLAIVGASGSGKSSLVRAGLVPALRKGQAAAGWAISILTPGARPLEALALGMAERDDGAEALSARVDALCHDPRSISLLIQQKLKASGARSLLLVIDQFEEVFALCRSEEERGLFIEALLAAASAADRAAFILIALRADFYAYCANYPQLRDVLARQQEYIGAMNDRELRRAIEEPARRGRWEFEPGLVDLLLHDVGHEPGALPLLSHALLETWQRRRGRTMTLSGYSASGGVRGAIAETAEAVFADQFTREQQEIARRIFLRLTELGDETSTGDTRRRASIQELTMRPEDAATTGMVLKVLADARLIITSEDAVEVAHEALIREWPTLRRWLEENREGLRLHRHLTGSAQEWQRLNREPDLLYRGARLTQATEWAESHSDALNELERAFLDASTAVREGEAREREAQRQRELAAAQSLAEAQRRRAEAEQQRAEVERQHADEQAQTARQLRRRALYLTGAFFAAIFMALAALFFASQARSTAVKAENDRRVAYARELSAAALNNLTIDPERSILLALQAVSTTRRVDGSVLPEAQEALHRSIVASPVRMTLRGHESRVLSVVYRPDGKQLASISDDGMLVVWDAHTGGELLRLPGTTKPGDLVTGQRTAYSPDGKLLAAGDNDTVSVYDAATGKRNATLTGQPSVVTAVAFSRDGSAVASGGADGTIVVWNAATGEARLKLAGHANAVEWVTFSPDGKWLVTASDDATLKIWDAVTGSLARSFEFTVEVYSAVFSPDGTRFAITSGNGLEVWQLDFKTEQAVTTVTNQVILSIPDGSGAVFSPDGSQLAASSGSSVKVWDAGTGREIHTLVGHNGFVMGVAFRPDGRQLASSSLDGTVKIWDLGPGQELVAAAGPAAGYGTRIAYSPDGAAFGMNGGNGAATLWDAATGALRQTFAGHNQEILSVAFSPDGKRFATGSLDATAIVWDVASGRQLFTLKGHEIGVRDIAFSPDGSRIATGGFDGTARLWDAQTGKELLKITGHKGLVLGVAFSPDGSRLATSSTDSTAKVWDVKTGDLILTLSGHTQPIPDIAYSPDGSMIATGSGDSTAILWDAATGKEIHRLEGHHSDIQSVAFRMDGKWLATGSGDKTAKIWDVATGKELLTFSNEQANVTGVAFRPSGGAGSLLVAGGGTARVYLLGIEDLIALAQTRVTRSFSTEECQRFLHAEQCPANQ